MEEVLETQTFRETLETRRIGEDNGATMHEEPFNSTSESDQASVESGDLSDDMCLLVSSEQEVSLPVIVSSVRPPPLPPAYASSLLQGPEGISMASSSVPDLEPPLVHDSLPSDFSVASEGTVLTVRAPLRRTTRTTAGYHSNVHHLPETMGDTNYQPTIRKSALRAAGLILVPVFPVFILGWRQGYGTASSPRTRRSEREMAGREPLIDPGGLRCDPGLTGREVNSGSEIDVDEEDVDDWSNVSEGNTNTGKWMQANRKKKKRKERDSDEDKSKVPLSKSEIKVIIKDSINRRWQVTWDQEKKGRHLYSIQKEVIGKEYSGLSRQEENMITRLRIGHTSLNGCLRIIGKHGLCTHCGEVENVEHILLRCRKYSEKRKEPERITNNELCLKKLLGMSGEQSLIKAVIIYLKETQLANRI
ncbi:hypothetical protein DPX16_1776 [Anabarilius grahami]|uniref:Uncharacterized protein n=1 Tax=Anabarilius grahami TaxID=495550 RepID=A0A3N0YBK2_ANAGA|nr:hypothetical protein DPX16_1776 [Anabarilius grahami]